MSHSRTASHAGSRCDGLEVATSNSMRVHIPPLSLCTDNAAMIAGLGYHYLRRLEGRGFEAHELNANSRLKMGALPPEA